jgi:acyl-coenzyme A thioesterase PaaI-like protein
MRELQDRFVAASPPLDATVPLAEQIEALAEQFEALETAEFRTPAGMRWDLPGRGNAMLAPVILDERTQTFARGRVTFRPFHLGRNGAAHGGTVTLLFDDVVGRLANDMNGRDTRTAYLHVNYRKIARIGVELRLDATVDRVEGRKRWASGRLWEGDELVADAEGLFVELRPGQP